MGFAGKRVRDPDGRPVEKRYQLRVEPGGLVLAVPQFRVLRVGPAGRERAVYQDDRAPDYLSIASAASRTNSSSTAFTSGTRTATYREIVGCDVSRVSR